MKIQLQSLREQLRNRTGKDPFTSPELAAVTSCPETTGKTVIMVLCFLDDVVLISLQASWVSWF